MSTEKLEQATIIIDEGIDTLKVVLREMISVKDNITLVLEENTNMKDENSDLEDERDKYYDVLENIKKALNDE